LAELSKLSSGVELGLAADSKGKASELKEKEKEKEKENPGEIWLFHQKKFELMPFPSFQKV